MRRLARWIRSNHPWARAPHLHRLAVLPRAVLELLDGRHLEVNLPLAVRHVLRAGGGSRRRSEAGRVCGARAAAWQRALCVKTHEQRRRARLLRAGDEQIRDLGHLEP